MNDPWDVKSVRQSGQYVSCMKLNGIPLLPPVLSKECRKEMQYYKLLAREVEKRITLLQPYIESENDTTSTDDKTDAPELPESELSYELHPEDVQAGFNVNIDKVTAISYENTLNKCILDSSQTKMYSCLTLNVPSIDKVEDTPTTNTPKFVIDLSVCINETGRTALDSLKSSRITPPVDLPERDYNCSKKNNQKEILMDLEIPRRYKQKDIEENYNYNYKEDKDILSDPFPGTTLNHDGPSSLSCKSFTGSLNNLNIESARESHIVPKLVRQSSYTLLKPSPQLLAHLEVQSLNAGVEMNSISMSESLSNLSTPSKKRRSWDLESAKVKWSNMALELKQKKLPGGVIKKQVTLPTPKKIPQVSPPRARSVVPDKPRRASITSKTLPKSEPVQKPKRSLSPVRNVSTRTIVKEPVNEKIEYPQPTYQLISESENPAARVRELYEKIQKQQLVQMASLVEKQKKEQILLQQVFEEQNNMLYKQLKSICPESPIEAKEAWVDQQGERGPVSLSQVINHKSPDQTIYDSPVTSTLIDTNKYINHCDNVLKKSRDLSGSIKKQQQPNSRNQNGSKIQTPKSISEGSRTRTHSPNQRFTPISRRLNYDTTASSERECDPILTDRSNDTMADLNVTFPSDNTNECCYFNQNNTVNQLCGKEVTVIHKSAAQNAGVHYRSTESAIKHVERILPNSKCVRNDKPKMFCNPTPQQREAASKIVAHAKGFLVRRLMRTERVQGTVQTIKDALLCALQLHQDREGIRGADVDLHRRLIQQITAACYSLHDTFIASNAAERCAVIAADRGRRRSLAARQPPPKPFRQTDI